MCDYYYEVEMKMTSQTAKEFLPWLKSHIVEMLNLGCFHSADLYEEFMSETDVTLRASYGYESSQKFQEYLDGHAEKMRGDLKEDLKAKIIFNRKHFKKVEV